MLPVTNKSFVKICLPDMCFHQLPVLEVDGKRVTQTLAIARYVAKEFGKTCIIIVHYPLLLTPIISANELSDQTRKF